jgi:hypothetical protein
MQGALLPDFMAGRAFKCRLRRVERKPAGNRRSISRETSDNHKPRRSPSIVVIGLARVELKRFGS